MEIGPDVSPFDKLQEAANVDSNGEGSVTDSDPFALSKEEFMKGIQEFGTYLNVSEKELEQLWEAISDGKPALSKDDFKLSDIKELALEFTGSNTSLMTKFSELMDSVSEED